MRNLIFRKILKKFYGRSLENHTVILRNYEETYIEILKFFKIFEVFVKNFTKIFEIWEINTP